MAFQFTTLSLPIHCHGGALRISNVPLFKEQRHRKFIHPVRIVLPPLSPIKASILRYPSVLKSENCITSLRRLYVEHSKLQVMDCSSHVKCRNSCYQNTQIARLPVPDDKVSWHVPWPEYKPPEYTSPVVHDKPWADPDLSDPNFKPEWNTLDGKVNRESHTGRYQILDKYPLNPIGRTGLRGRGYLGRWGPNHAADPVVSRWKTTEQGDKVVHPVTSKSILQFIAIQRRDTGEWAIPGGMVDPGELVSQTVRREFCEEALNSLSLSEKDRSTLLERLEDFFKSGREVHRGYVDDPRNTDNAWMETVVYNFHDEDQCSVARFPLQAGDDAANVQWMDVDSQLKLYASHLSFLKKVADTNDAHF